MMNVTATQNQLVVSHRHKFNREALWRCFSLISKVRHTPRKKKKISIGILNWLKEPLSSTTEKKSIPKCKLMCNTHAVSVFVSNKYSNKYDFLWTHKIILKVRKDYIYLLIWLNQLQVTYFFLFFFLLRVLFNNYIEDRHENESSTSSKIWVACWSNLIS
jgi:hypothetical protein